MLFGGFYVTTVWAKLICRVLFMAWLVLFCGYDRLSSDFIFVCCCGRRLCSASFMRLVTFCRYNLSVRLGIFVARRCFINFRLIAGAVPYGIRISGWRLSCSWLVKKKLAETISK